MISAIVIFWAVYFYKRIDKVSANKARTEVLVANKIFNNGYSKHNKPVIADFEITNIGKNSLIIDNVKTDCNCTATEWEKNPILPQHKTTIKLVYNGTTMGYFQKKAMVYCNVANSPLLLILRGKIDN